MVYRGDLKVDEVNVYVPEFEMIVVIDLDAEA